MTSPEPPPPENLVQLPEPSPPKKSRSGGIVLAVSGPILVLAVFAMPLQVFPDGLDNPTWWDLARYASHPFTGIPTGIQVSAYALLFVGILSLVVGVTSAVVGSKIVNLAAAAVGALAAGTVFFSLLGYTAWVFDSSAAVSGTWLETTGIGYYAVDMVCLALTVGAMLTLVGAVKKAKAKSNPASPPAGVLPPPGNVSQDRRGPGQAPPPPS